jgi:hypothetical protein
MVRTQIYLTAGEQQALRALSRRTGISQSELIRQAIDSRLASEQTLDRKRFPMFPAVLAPYRKFS